MNQKPADWSSLFLRLALGVVFVAHGSQKIFSFGIAGVSGYLASLGVPLPDMFAIILILTEFVGGIFVLIGLLTRLASLFIMIAMAVAVLAVHITKGFFLPEGIEYPFVLFFVALALVLSGAGKFSLDAALFGRKHPAAA